MPIIAQAKKKLRHDRKKAKINAVAKESLRTVIKSYRKKPTPKALNEVFSLLDKSQKRNLIHANKSSRLKSRLSKMLIKK